MYFLMEGGLQILIPPWIRGVGWMMRVRERGESPGDMIGLAGRMMIGGVSREKERGQWDGWGLEEPSKKPASPSHLGSRPARRVPC